MTFSGDVRGGISLTDVLQNIAANRVSGTLHVRWRQHERFVRVEGGAIVGLSIGVGKGLPILDHLRERGYVDERRLDKVLARARRSRKSVYRVVGDAGLLDDAQLGDALTELVEEQLFELLALRDAEFSFSEGPAPNRVFDADQKRLALRLEIGPILMESARRADELERIQRVMTSDRDVFVLLEGWDAVEPDELTAVVAPLLDGRQDVRTIARAVRASRFSVMKCISDLVQQGGARPLTPSELDALAAEAIEGEDSETALRLLDAALRIERSNDDLRIRKAELLEQVGRAKDAAAEYALLGHAAGQAEQLDEAIAFYARAAELDPTDVPLREQRVALLMRGGDVDELVARVVELVDLELDTGLADRARTLLIQTLGDRACRDRTELIAKLARVESSLGHWKEASDLYVRLANLAFATDEAAGLEYLRKALDQRPDDSALAQRIADIESGRARRRAARRRRATFAAVCCTVVLGLGVTGVAEIVSSHRVNGALDLALGDLRDGRAVDALVELDEVGAGWGWTVAGRKAPRLVERVVDLQLRAVESLIADAEYDRAVEICGNLSERLARADLRSTCATLLERAGIERKAYAILARSASGVERASDADVEWLAGLADPRYLDFHIAHLPRVADRAVRRALLSALERIDDPRALPVVARMSLELDDAAALATCERLLRRADHWRGSGREPEWACVYPELERAQLRPETRGQAQLALGLLRGGGASH